MMRYGIFSDVHSNLEALGVALDYYKKEKISQFIFLGDIIGYGANPFEVISLLRSLNPVCIAGNHDWGVPNKLSIDYFNQYAQAGIIWTKRKITQEQIFWLYSLPLTFTRENFICVHGSLTDPERFYYIMDKYDAELNFPLLEKQICFVAHSHRKGVYFSEGKRKGTTHILDDKVELKEKGKYIVNVGSVGQPRDSDPRACVCIYDSDLSVVSFNRLEYNIKIAADKILEAGLPPILASRLYSGW